MPYLEKVREMNALLGEGKKEKEMDKAANSLDYFYAVRDSAKRKGKGINDYSFVGDVYEKDGLIIVPITDVHIGYKQCNVPYFKAFIQYILDVPNCVTVLNGDLAETATKSSVGMAMFEEDIHLPEQILALVELLQPLADANKILGIIPGNHEQRMDNLLGFNPMHIIADKLNVPYLGYQGFLRLDVCGIKYKVAMFHGAGGGGTSGSRTNTAEKQNKVIPNADLYISGHTHGKMSHSDVVWMMDDTSDSLVEHKRTYVVGGSFVEYFNSYPEMKGLAPSSTGLTHITLTAGRKDVRIAL